MAWRKLGLVFQPDGSLPWAHAYAMIPTPLMRPDGMLRLYIACADSNTVARITYLDIDPRNPTKVVYTPSEPALGIGDDGAFDDNGVNPCSIIELAPDHFRLYYIGYQLQKKIPYTLFAGIAEASSSDGPFHRLKSTPALERTPQEMFFRTAPCVLRDGDHWRMWYVGGGGWIDIDGKAQPIYSVRHIESRDGLDWSGHSTECFAPNFTDEIGFGRPFVRKLGTAFEMYFSIRGRKSYKAGYAVSTDGLTWTRKDQASPLVTSAEGWDSEMVCYSAVVDGPSGQLMYYNGNGFGRTGVGVCIREDV